MAEIPLLASPSVYFSFLLYRAATSEEFLSLALSLPLGVAELEQGNVVTWVGCVEERIGRCEGREREFYKIMLFVPKPNQTKPNCITFFFFFSLLSILKVGLSNVNLVFISKIFYF